MKKYKISLLATLATTLGFVGCVSEDDVVLPEIGRIVYFEDFQDTATHENWTNVTEIGSKSWGPQEHNGNVYYEFSPFQSGNELNIGWFVSPAINTEEASLKRLTFEVAHHHVINTENNYIQAYISTDFDGENVLAATWTEFGFNKPTPAIQNYEFIKSGIIDLSDYSGTIYVAFKVTGGTDSQNAGAYMIDNVRVF